MSLPRPKEYLFNESADEGLYVLGCVVFVLLCLFFVFACCIIVSVAVCYEIDDSDEDDDDDGNV
jgi:hypothetical protein